jgi:4-hydroxybenzoate polyprenyltransferase
VNSRAGTHAAENASGRAVSFAAAIFDMSRGRQALISVAQPVLCALLALDGHLPSLRIVTLGAVAAVSGELAVFSLNDVLDHRADRESLRLGKHLTDRLDIDTVYEQHPLARGDVALATGIAWELFLCLVFIVSAWQLSPLCVLFFAVAVCLEVVYCLLRRVTWFKTVVSGVMVGIGSLAGWVAVAPLDRRAVWPFLFLSVWETGGRNMANDLADLEWDARTGTATVACRYGARAAARAIFATMLAAVALAALLPAPLLGRVFAAAAGVWFMLLPGWRLLREPDAARTLEYFNRASLYPVAVLVAVLCGWAVAGSW